MCGITGFWTKSSKREEDLLIKLRRATDVIFHRGPDDEGHWIEPGSGMALGFRRLSIQDLSEAGHQPMISHSGRYVITFNGEVYNAPALKKQLPDLGYEFRGHSDTEIMLAAFETWGIEASVKKFIGMFGFALWDTQERVLTLVTDRVGIKPLYYGFVGDSLVWGSELKSLETYTDNRLEPDPIAINDLFTGGYITAPRSIYKAISKVIPGQVLQFRAPDAKPAASLFWSMREVAEHAHKNKFQGSETDAIDQLEALLKDSIDLRMLSDVPLGAFLSGGIDSTTVVALMQTLSSKATKTFTIGFTEKGYDESGAAREIAKHLKTDHHEMMVTPKQALDVIPMLATMYDEPFADSSQIPTYLVSKLAREKVTVSLSGDGGDEIFAGYNRYRFQHELWEKIKKVPKPLRSVLASSILCQSPEMLNVTMAPLKSFAARSGRKGPIGPKMRRFAHLLKSKSFYELNLLALETGTSHHLLASKDHSGVEMIPPLDWMTDIEAMQYEDMHRYLPGDILTKVDRASMAVSLEARVPILDHRIVEFAWTLPGSMKMRGLDGKWVLKNVLYRHVPKELMDRPKTGFGIPVGAWLKNELRDWAETLLSKQAIEQVGILDAQAVRTCYDQHLSGGFNNEPTLWRALMLQGWGLKGKV